MYRQLLAATLVLVLSPAVLAESHPEQTCQPLGMNYAQLEASYNNRLADIADSDRPEYLKTVLPCLHQLDPFLRDQIGYEATASLLRRQGELDPAMKAALTSFKDELIARLEPDVTDPHGVMKPFAIILLAETARTDRIHDWMSKKERTALIETAHDYLVTLEDYRAFEDGVGFRHGVAHGADLILQLSINRHIEAKDLVPLIQAVEAKISPRNGAAYTTGEPGRLVRALFYLIQRSGDSDELKNAISALLENLQDPAPYDSWGQVFSSEAGLIFRHNRRAFAEALYVQLSPHSEHELIAPFTDLIGEAVKAIP